MAGTLDAVYGNESDEMRIRISTELTGSDLSGDYNAYSAEWDRSFKGLSVHCMGDGETANAALFDVEDLHYAISLDPGLEGRGLTMDELNSILMGMQAVRYEG